MGEPTSVGERLLRVEVAYALPDSYRIVPVVVQKGTSVLDTAMQSGIDAFYPEIEWPQAKLGVFGKVVANPSQQAVEEGDRVEVYRPLQIDPKEVRRRRAEKAKSPCVSNG